MLLPMSPANSVFLMAEARERPMHVGSLQLFTPPDGADALDVRAMFDKAIAQDEVAPIFQKRARRTVTSLGQWGWEVDGQFDLEHHVRRNALPQPGRIRDLLVLCSRLHSTLLDRKRPLWEMHLIEGLEDGRYAVYSKVHHALLDGVSALRLLNRMLSEDPNDLDMPGPWAPRMGRRKHERHVPNPARQVVSAVGELVGVGPSFARTMRRALQDQTSMVSLSAPHSMFNVPITGARRFAAQSWSTDRIKAVGKAVGGTVNDAILAMCSGALRNYMLSLGQLPDSSLVSMVPVSLHGDESVSADAGGNNIGVVMCKLGTDKAEPLDRLQTVHESMVQGKQALASMSQLQIVLMSGLAMSPLVVYPALGITASARPPFNLVISTVPGPNQPLFWNGARLDGLYPLSIPLDGQALNITTTTYDNEIGFGLTGCRRTVPHLQRLLNYLDDELVALEKAVA